MVLMAQNPIASCFYIHFELSSNVSSEDHTIWSFSFIESHKSFCVSVSYVWDWPTKQHSTAHKVQLSQWLKVKRPSFSSKIVAVYSHSKLGVFTFARVSSKIQFPLKFIRGWVNSISTHTSTKRLMFYLGLTRKKLKLSQEAVHKSLAHWLMRTSRLI